MYSSSNRSFYTAYWVHHVLMLFDTVTIQGQWMRERFSLINQFALQCCICSLPYETTITHIFITPKCMHMESATFISWLFCIYPTGFVCWLQITFASEDASFRLLTYFWFGCMLSVQGILESIVYRSCSIKLKQFQSSLFHVSNILRGVWLSSQLKRGVHKIAYIGLRISQILTVDLGHLDLWGCCDSKVLHPEASSLSQHYCCFIVNTPCVYLFFKITFSQKSLQALWTMTL